MCRRTCVSSSTPDRRLPASRSVLQASLVILLLGLMSPSGVVLGGEPEPSGGYPPGKHTEAEEPYLAEWLPYYLYVSDSSLLIPESLISLASVGRKEGVVSGLTATRCGTPVFYATATSAGSSLIRIDADEPPHRVVAAAADMGDDLWFRAPMSVCPGKRWMLVTVSPGRTAMLEAQLGEESVRAESFSEYSGDLWLVDCARLVPPRMIVAGARLVRCAWSPSGQYAACEVTWQRDARTAIAVIGVERGNASVVTGGRGQIIWSADSRSIEVWVERPGSFEVVFYEVETAESRVSVTHGGRTRRHDSVWSPSGEVCAWVDRESGCASAELADTSGRHRSVAFPSPVAQLLGFSCQSELLALVCGDGSLHFCSGVVSDLGYEALMSVLPSHSVPAGEPSLREGFSLHTTKSPIKVSRPERVMAAWTEGSSGPRFVYVADRKSAAPGIYALSFKRACLSDFGIDPERDVRQQVIRQGSLSNLRQVTLALLNYADDNDGRLPLHESGQEVAKDLEDYIGDASILSSPYGHGEIRIRLLAPGADLGAMRRELPRDEFAQIRIVELRSDDGFTFVGFADGHVEEAVGEEATAASRGE